MIAVASINSMIETAIGVDVRGVVAISVGVTTAPIVAEVVTAAVSFAVPVRAKDQERVRALIEWIEVLALRECMSCSSDDDGFALLDFAVGRGTARSGGLVEMRLRRTLDHFGTGSGGRSGVRRCRGSRACDGQADGEGKRDNNGGEAHGDGDNARRGLVGLYEEPRECC